MTDPIYGLPIRDNVLPELLEGIGQLERKKEIIGDSEEETKEGKRNLKSWILTMHSARPAIIIPERDKVLWEKLAKRCGLKHRVVDSAQWH